MIKKLTIRSPQNRPLLAFALGLLPLLSAAPTMAAGGLLVAPTRIVIEGNERYAEVNLMNTGQQEATYRLSFVNQRMSYNGALKPVSNPTESPNDHFADSMLRFTPRQVVLPPRESQTVRILVRKPSNLAEGEYRTHLKFTEIPTSIGNTLPTVKEDDKKALRIQIIPVYGVTIPVIVRHGSPRVSTDLSDLNYVSPENPTDPATLRLRVNRDGQKSVYGDFKVFFQPAKELSEVEVGAIRGVGVYTSVPYREVRVPIQIPEKYRGKQGRLRIEFIDGEGSSKKLAEAGTDIILE